MGDKNRYLTGFGNEHATEALEMALPLKGNSPQKPLYGLYAEQMSGAPFMAPRAQRLRSWLYRIRPSILKNPFVLNVHPHFIGAPFNTMVIGPDPLRWDPHTIPSKPMDWVDGIKTIAGAGDSGTNMGLAIHIYVATAARRNRFFCNNDAEMLFIPEKGAVSFRTEMGILDVAPGEIVVIPRGIRFALTLLETTARGYICENYGPPLTLPDLGPLGANALAYPRHFLYPIAAFEDKEGDYELICKHDDALWRTSLDHSPLDVVAWHGNYAPYKYDLSNFMTVNAVSFDHADPSIFTVLTSPGNVDFVIFPPRWQVAEATFRPPYFHRNVMSEFMGLIKGGYEGKEGGGFLPGGASLHNAMTPHGPDAATFEKASQEKLEPVQLKEGLAFMLESARFLRATPYAFANGLQKDYLNVWQDLKKNFKSV